MAKRDLFQAVRRRDAAALQQEIDVGADLEARVGGRSVLHLAADMAWLDGVSLLLAAGADVAARDRGGATPLHRVAEDGRGIDAPGLLGREKPERQGRTVPFPEEPTVGKLVLQALHRLEFLDDPTLPEDPWDRRTFDVAQAFHRATWEDDARARLLQELETLTDLDLTAPDLAGHLRRDWPSAQVCELLLDAGADIEARDDDGATAFFIAVGHGAEAAASLLLERGADAHVENERGESALLEAVERGHVEIAALLLDAGALPVDVLGTAAAGGAEEMVGLLLSRGADPRGGDDDFERPLHAAARGGHVGTVGLLLLAGARAGDVNAYGETALHLAAGSHGPISILARLADDAGVDPLDQNGCTPLFAATAALHREAVEALLSLGADARRRSHSGATVLHAFFEDLDAFDPQDAGRLLRHLVAAGADPTGPDADGRSAFDIARGWRADWLLEALGAGEPPG